MVVNEFRDGTVTLLDTARVAPSMATESVNLMQTQDGLWSSRWGRAYYGIAISAEAKIDGIAEYVTSTGARELIAIGGTTGTAYRSQNDGATWTALTGQTFTPGKTPYFKQIASLLLISNGTDVLAEYNGTTTLQTFASLATPTNLQLARNVLTAGSYNAFYQVTALNAVGETVACTEVSITVNKTRDTWDGTTESIALTWNAVSNALRYQIYYSDQSGYEEYLDSVTTNSYTDNATSQVNPYIVVPNDNSTTAPLFKQMELSDNRIWGTGSTADPFRVYFSGVGVDVTNFSAWYGGGWVDLEKGGRQTPIAVVHYRNGNGNSAATVLCSSPDGIGTIWQITMDTVTVGTTQIVVPTPVKVVGSIGTTSPQGVIAVGNDIYFPNKQGVFTLGNAPQLLNVLATNEKTQNIRPSYRGMNQSLIANICAVTYQAKIFFSCAVGTQNDTIFIYDTELRNWNWSWNFGAKQFLEATDANGTTHLLYVPPTGNQLVEINENFGTDFGGAFNTSYISGLLPFSKDDTVFAKVKEVIVSLGRFQGQVTVQVLGVDAKAGFSTAGSAQVSDTLSAITFVESIFGNYLFSSRVGSPKVFAQPSTKKRIKVGKKLNNLQIHISSNTAGTQYSLLEFQVRGDIIPTSIPQSWK